MEKQDADQLQEFRNLENTVKKDIREAITELNDQRSEYFRGFNKDRSKRFVYSEYQYFSDFSKLPKLFRTTDAEARLGEDNRTLNDKVAKIRLRANQPYERIMSHDDFFFNIKDNEKTRIYLHPEGKEANMRIFLSNLKIFKSR